jgi:hypothetical protein
VVGGVVEKNGQAGGNYEREREIGWVENRRYEVAWRVNRNCEPVWIGRRQGKEIKEVHIRNKLAAEDIDKGNEKEEDYEPMDEPPNMVRGLWAAAGRRRRDHRTTMKSI